MSRTHSPDGALVVGVLDARAPAAPGGVPSVPAVDIRWAQVVLTAAQQEVGSVRADVATCQGLPWRSAAAVAYEDQMVAAAGDLGLCARGLMTSGDLLAAGIGGGPTWCTSDDGPAPPVPGWSTPVPRSTVGGTSVRVGADGVTSVDPEALQAAAARLTSCAERLDHVHASLSALMVALPTPVLVDNTQRASISLLLTARWSPHRLAEHLRELAKRLRAAAAVHAEGESTVSGVVRGAGAVWGGLLGLLPAPVLAVEGVLAAGTAGLAGLALLGETARVVGPEKAAQLAEAAGTAAGKAAVRSGAVEVATTAVSAVARGQAGGLPTLHPVPGGAAAIARLITGPAGTAVVTPVAAPVHQPAPHGLADVMQLVASSYGGSAAPGTEPGTVTIQRLDRPDGTRSWLVAVPGTQTMAMSGAVPTDMGTNLRLEAGLADTMTAGVLAAMRQADIPAGQPVTLVGHSQGGMVAMNVAARAGKEFTVGAVVTAGSPDVPAQLPPAVPVIRMEHVEDGTARLDGAPTRVTPQVTAITRELADDGEGTPDWGSAHGIGNYVETGRRVDEAVAEAPGSIPGVSALDGVLGGPGTVATTSQYVIRREAG